MSCARRPHCRPALRVNCPLSQDPSCGSFVNFRRDLGKTMCCSDGPMQRCALYESRTAAWEIGELCRWRERWRFKGGAASPRCPTSRVMESSNWPRASSPPRDPTRLAAFVHRRRFPGRMAWGHRTRGDYHSGRFLPDCQPWSMASCCCVGVVASFAHTSLRGTSVFAGAPPWVLAKVAPREDRGWCLGDNMSELWTMSGHATIRG